jgi:hypothetical protein
MATHRGARPLRKRLGRTASVAAGTGRPLSQGRDSSVTCAIPAATLRPLVPSMLAGCSLKDPLNPPISTLAPAPTPTAVLPLAPP